jgi:hypothetical protein
MATKYWERPFAAPVPTFARSTVAYDESGSHAIDAKRTCSLALVGTSDGAIPAGEGASNEHIRPTCRNSSYMFGIGFTTGRIYKSTDGSTWVTTDLDTGIVGTAGVANGGLFALANGNLVQFRYGGAAMTVAKNVTNTGGLLTITSTGAFANALTNMWMYVKFSDATYTDGYYKITRVSNDVITLQGTTYSADKTCTFIVPSACLVSTNNGATFTVSDFKLNVTAATLAASYIPSWGFFEYGGVLMAAEYGAASALGGRYIHKSTDGGATWTRACDMNTSHASSYHFHTIGYHAGTGKWIAFYGDSTVNGAIVSSDNGVTWSDFVLPSSGGQPITTLDTGDPTRLLLGNDNSACVSWIDMNTGVYDVAFDLTNHLDTRAFCFMLCKYAGAYYAGGFDNAATVYAPCLWVSTDLVNWSVYHKFTEADAVHGFAYGYAGFAGVAGGKLHFTVMALVSTQVPRHFSITPANIRNVGGALIEPASTNLLTEDQSNFETAHNLIDIANTTLAQGSVPFVGDHCASITMTAAGECGCRTGVANAATADITLGDVATTAIKTYVITARMKATAPIKTSLKLWKNGTTYSSGAYTAVWAVDTKWRTFTAAITIAAADYATNYHIAPYFTQVGTDYVTVYLDALSIHEAPITEFGLGAAAQAADILTSTITTPAAFTDIFAVQSLGRNIHYLAPADLFIKTWKVGSDELQLFWDVSESKFTIQRNAETAVASTAQEWHPNQVIKFALRADAAGLTLDIQNGRAAEHIHDSALAALLSADMTMIYGDVSSANQFPGRYFDGTMEGSALLGMGFIPFRLSDAEIVETLNLAASVVGEESLDHKTDSRFGYIRSRI